MSLNDTIAWFNEVGSEQTKQDMLRYGIPNDNAVGIPMGVLKAKGKRIGTDPELARALWSTGIYEARTLAVFVHEPNEISEDEADHWVADFDGWAICDTACFHLIDRTAFAWDRINIWAASDREFVRRAAFATIWGLSGHDKTASDEKFQSALDIIAFAPPDDRPLVRKAVNMALRAVGKRNLRLNKAAIDVASTLMKESTKDRQWIGRHALRELESEKVQPKLRV